MVWISGSAPGPWPPLFRLLYDEGSHRCSAIPPRHGSFFSPGAQPFLDESGRRPCAVPRERLPYAGCLSDGGVHGALENLLVRDGEWISFGALDVEQIGSVSEAIGGGTLRVSTGPVVAAPHRRKRMAVDVRVELVSLLVLPAAERVNRPKDQDNRDLAGAQLSRMRAGTQPANRNERHPWDH